jgi:hypothetical protein
MVTETFPSGTKLRFTGETIVISGGPDGAGVVVVPAGVVSGGVPGVVAHPAIRTEIDAIRMRMVSPF